MRKFKFFTNMKIRSSLILVLVFFLMMLLAGAALGVLSLQANHKALDKIVMNQRLGASLYSVIDNYKNVQTILGRAVTSYMVNSDQQSYAIASEWGGMGGNSAASALSDESRALIEEARQQYDQSLVRFAGYREMAAKALDPEKRYARVIDGYQTLMEGGVLPLLDLLTQGKVAEYHEFLGGTTLFLEEDLYSALGSLESYQKDLIDRTYQSEDEHYTLVLQLVGAAMAVCVLIALLTYMFLGRMVLRPLREAGRHFDRIANGDLTQRVEVRSHNEIGVLYEALRRMQESLTRTVSTVREGVEEITLGSREIFMGNTDLSSRTEQQAASLQETAASMEQLASTVRMNTDNALQADALAKGASDVAERGGQAVSMVVNTMGEISASSHKMAEIVGVIDGIAFQTNILAL
ncbi:Tar ligand binding domain-containing protein, partial [Pusillimonas harenae]